MISPEAMDFMIIAIDGFGFAFFCAAFYFGMHNYNKFENSRVLWALFNIAMFCGVFMSLYKGIEVIGIYPEIMRKVADAMTLVLVVMLFTFAVVEKEESKRIDF